MAQRALIKGPLIEVGTDIRKVFNIFTQRWAKVGSRHLLKSEGTRGEGHSITKSWRVLEPQRRGHVAGALIWGGSGGNTGRVFSPLTSISCQCLPLANPTRSQPTGKPAPGCGAVQRIRNMPRSQMAISGLPLLPQKPLIGDTVTLEISSAVSYKFKHTFTIWPIDSCAWMFRVPFSRILRERK